MNPQLLVILVGLFYILIAGGISLLRQEGLSSQFALEALAIIVLAVLFGFITDTTVNPILLFVILYLVTMRARLLTDLANFVFKRWGYATAERFYQLALRLLPDRTGRYIVLINWGVARLRNKDFTDAIATFKKVLTSASQGNGLGPKYEAACRYNLALACRKTGDNLESVRQFNQVIELFPASIYAQAAEKALKKGRERSPPQQDT